jgi:RecA-family ATPase
MERNQPDILPVRYYSTLSAKQVDWLFYPYIPYGKITLIQGDPGDGKTTFVLNIAALLSNGLTMPETDAPVDKAKVLYQSAEDGAEDTMKPRLVSAGADCANIAFIDESDAPLTLDSPRFESAILETGARMLVLDPLQAYAEGGDMNRADGIRPMLKRLAGIAERTRCAVVIIGHMNKSSSAKGLYRGLGSIDITAAARSILLIGRTKNNPHTRVMVQLKNSLAKEGSAIAFEINENSEIRWIGKYDITADDLLMGNAKLDDDTKNGTAERIIREILADGLVPCSCIYAQCGEIGIGKRTVEKAKRNLNVKSAKRADGWYWSLGGVPDD